MGFVRSTLLLDFSDFEGFEGFEVRARRLSVGAILYLAELRATNWTEDKKAKEAFDDLSGVLAEAFISWNLEVEELDDDDKPTGNQVPVPLTAESVAAQDFAMVLAMSGALFSASRVAPPLSRPSSDGDTSVEASIPMEPLSDSLPSSSEPEPS